MIHLCLSFFLQLNQFKVHQTLHSNTSLNTHVANDESIHNYSKYNLTPWKMHVHTWIFFSWRTKWGYFLGFVFWTVGLDPWTLKQINNYSKFESVNHPRVWLILNREHAFWITGRWSLLNCTTSLIQCKWGMSWWKFQTTRCWQTERGYTWVSS